MVNVYLLGSTFDSNYIPLKNHFHDRFFIDGSIELEKVIFTNYQLTNNKLLFNN